MKQLNNGKDDKKKHLQLALLFLGSMMAGVKSCKKGAFGINNGV
jgi:hypothetical protein